MVEILRAGSLEQDDKIAANAQRLIDSVLIRHKDILMWCDSAYTYTGTNRVDAFGHVHINQGDTLHLYARKVLYDGDRSFARAIKNVRLENKSTTLYTDTLDYDMDMNIGYYDDSGKIVDSTNTLISNTGQYFLDEDMVHFTDSVVGFSDNYTLTSDNIKYNTKTEVIYLGGPTTIRDSANTLYAEDGWYNTATGEADLTKKPEIFNETQLIRAKQIYYNKANGDGNALGSVHIHDFENRTIVKGNTVVFNDVTDIASVTDSAVFISYNETDSLFLHADTLRTVPDTIEEEKIIKAFYGVRFFRNDVQGICDSLTYYTKDSVVQLNLNPVIWSNIHQMSANAIELIQNTNAPDEMHLTNNSFIISKQDSGQFDQIKGKNMIGYVVNQELDKIDVDGNGQTLYYAREEEEIIGLNRAESSNILIKFREGRIYKISFLSSPEGELKPLPGLTEDEKTLSGFEWKINQRPLSKFEIFPDWKHSVKDSTRVVKKPEPRVKMEMERK
ncbi:MAG: OstA-like protein [Bacteroidota bacterium]